MLTATAVSATMGQASAFALGREFAAWLGLVPAHTGTGGKTRMLGISKRGDSYVRTLLIHGARSVFSSTKHPGPWLQKISQRRPLNVAVVALANKMARTIWALLALGEPTSPTTSAGYQPKSLSVNSKLSIRAAANAVLGWTDGSQAD
jgi:transposase